ncbi:MAG: hypothetical protein IPL65_11045 [Lewinellaceae bacterium]|nr:hypothetical protein [Lewinellaceae bacterium]
MKKYFILLLLGLLAYGSNAQEDCATSQYLDRLLQSMPGLRAQRTSLEAQIRTWVQNNPIDPHLHQIPISIPVVVHILKRNAAEDVSDATIRAQIALTNEHLKGNAPNISTVPIEFRNLKANCRIKLVLAFRDPNGRATDGIKRYTVTKAEYTMGLDDAKKASTGGADPWDPSRYLNVWVCNLKDWCGYGTFPFIYESATTLDLQGIVMERGCFGPTATKNGTSFTHELGHFLGIKHVWGDADCGNDDIADTPQQKDPTIGSPTGVLATNCTGSAPNGRMYQNMMDYSANRCMYTVGQARNMWAYLNYYDTQARAIGRTGVTSRNSLTNSDALLPPGGTAVEYTVDFIPEYENLPAWKAALAMVHSHVTQTCITVDEINRLTAAGGSARGSRYQSLPADLANAIFGLGLSAEEVIMSYTPQGFMYDVMGRGPVALIEKGSVSLYGLVISGMRVQGDDAVVMISDPMNVGPQQFHLAVTQDGHQKTVPYDDLVAFMDNAVIAGKTIYIVRPPN